MSRERFRIEDMLAAIADIESLLDGKTADDAFADRVVRAAFERFLEIISEASRYVSDTNKAFHPDIPWKSIADTGNHLRHAYHRVDFKLLWNVYEQHLPPLKTALQDILSRIEGK